MTMGITSKARQIISGVVTLIVLFVLVANLLPEGQAAGDQLNASLGGTLLSNLFASTGFVWLLFMVGVLLTVIAIILPGKKGV